MLKSNKPAVPLHLPLCPGSASAKAMSNIATYRFQQGQTSSLFLPSPASPACESRCLHNTDTSKRSPTRGAPGVHLTAAITLSILQREPRYALTPFTLPPKKKKKSLPPPPPPSFQTQLPVELAHFLETCNYTAWSVSVLIRLLAPHGDGSQAPSSLPPLPSPRRAARCSSGARGQQIGKMYHLRCPDKLAPGLNIR